MGVQANEALATAAAALLGQVVRTSASVIGKLRGESVIVATSSWGYTVSVVVTNLHVAFRLRARGWLKRSLVLEGEPLELAQAVIDAPTLDRVAALGPLQLELGPTALRLDHKYGSPAEMAEAIDLVVSLAARARQVDARGLRAAG